MPYAHHSFHPSAGSMSSPARQTNQKASHGSDDMNVDNNGFIRPQTARPPKAVSSINSRNGKAAFVTPPRTSPSASRGKAALNVNRRSTVWPAACLS
eukprot:scaffold541638_cov53-Prasinocladus_malaysianus.AAC.1